MTRKPQQNNTGIMYCKSHLKSLRNNGNLHILVSLHWSGRKARYLIHASMSTLYHVLVQQLHLSCIQPNKSNNKRLGRYLLAACEIAHMSNITTGHWFLMTFSSIIAFFISFKMNPINLILHSVTFSPWLWRWICDDYFLNVMPFLSLSWEIYCIFIFAPFYDILCYTVLLLTHSEGLGLIN